MLNSKQIWQILDKQTQIIDNLSIRSALPLALARTSRAKEVKELRS